MIKKTTFLKTLLVAAGLLVGTSVWADDWSTVWSSDFSSAPSGMTYSVTNGAVSISDGYINYQQNGGSGDRAINTAFTDSKFNVDTNWKMEFDWNCGSANTNASYVTFATNNGSAFTLTWVKYASAVVVTDAASTEICNSLPLLGYKQGTCSSWSHIIITGDTDKGIYLTITNGATTYVDNVLVTSTFGYPATFNGSLGKAVSSMFIDNVSFATPKVAGYVAPPTGIITAPDGTARKFTLSCLTDGATIYYAESDIEIGATGWTTYSSEVTTSAETIYAYASDGVNNSEKINFATGAGTAITLNAPTITLSGLAATAEVYYPVVTIENNQSGLALVPASTTLTYKLDGSTISASSPYTFTGTGVLSVTVSADGYTSNSANYTVNNGYIKTKTIDLAAITAGDLSTVWTKTSDASQLPAANWISRYSSDEFPLYVYDYRNASASTTDVIEGLIVNISSSDADPGVTPTLYVGAGLILPTKKLNASDLSESGTWNTNIGVSVNGGTAEQIAVYTYPTNYGQSTTTSTIAANATYNLYRFSDMLTKVEVYSPNVIPVTIKETGTTFSSAYAIDCANLPSGVTAYKVTKMTATQVTAVEVTEAVAAGTGLIFKATAEKSYDIPVAATGTDISATNLLKAAVDATHVDDNEAYGLSAGVFKKLEAGNVPAGKAYLLASDITSAPELTIDFGGTTGIENVNRETITNNRYFNLSGQRIAQPTKGLYIVNGRKVVFK